MTSLKKPSPLDFKTQYGLALDDADDAIIVDLFAGGGGASTGLEMGLSRKVDLAINHNPAAISMHEANHPHAEHLPTDVWGIDPIEATKGATVGWLHASPDCRHHSQAAGGQPTPTVATGGHHMLVTPEMIAGSLTPEQLDGALWVSAFLMRYHSTGGQWAKLDDPLTTITTKDRLALVTVWISGSPYVIVDIRLRMLKPRELYRAQGFPDSYIIERGHNGQRFTLSQQVHMCGNSVSPNTMAAYARANDPWKRRLRPRPQQVAA